MTEAVELDPSPFANKSYTPTLHDVFNLLGKRVVGEEEARLALFTNWVLARKYCILTGSSRSGKTWLKDAVKDLILGDSSEGGLCYTMKQGSTKSGWYAYEELSKASFVDIPELNQLPIDMMEVLKTWGENKTAEYSVVETINSRKQNKKYVLPYKPFVFAIADENNLTVPAELRYRLIEIRTDSSQEQTDRIIKKQAAKELDPFDSKNKEITHVDNDMKLHIKTMPLFQGMIYVNPMATFVAEKVPKNFTDARTAHPVFQDGIKGLQRFYWKQSLIKEVNGKKVLFISPQAVMENYIVNGRVFLNSVMKCNDIELEMLNVLRSHSPTTLTRKEIARALRSNSINIRDSMIAKHLQTLEDLNYVEVRTTGSTKHYLISADADLNGFHIKGQELLDHCRIVMERLHPEHYEEYVETYLDRPTFIHPFTGKVVDLRTFNLGTAPKTVSKANTLEVSSTAEVMKNEEAGISEEVVMDSLQVDEDMMDALEDDVDEETTSLKEWLKGKAKMYVEDFIDKYGQTTLDKLLEEGEVFQPETDTVQPLN